MLRCDVLVLGGGAAGLMAAAEAGRRGRQVLLVDHADRVGKKILISGGGRCNFTNLGCRAGNFVSENPHFARSALSQYTAQDFVAMVERHGIQYHEKTLGQLFCDTTSRAIVAMLERECAEAEVRVMVETTVGALRQGDAGFVVETSAGEVRAESVIVATGGLSIPKMGATGLGYEVARQFGLRVVETQAGLVPFTLGGEEKERWCDLSGVSAEVIGRVVNGATKKKGPPEFREKVLVTHKGLSGPAVLQVSSYWQAGQEVELDLAPGQSVFGGLLERNARRDGPAALQAVKAVLPTRWAERWLHVFYPAAERDLSNVQIAELERQMHGWRVRPAGTEGFEKAEVTTGGVDTAELDGRTLEAKRVRGLFFIGEVVDVTGWLGGYNFQWAWASGFCAGQVA